MGQFESFSAFLQMGHHAKYVWLSYGSFAIGVVYLIVAPKIRQRQFVKQQLQKYRREES
ncbi:heme exporter protein CcmD [Gynuella sunshinyii]|uniref:Heme exporter protein D n=1 Tax=Gynuella sunshinyii YC6258 TaxID=1445510 RepID=A0A0C5VTU9_9GAMM|nr:heme exporter protein CcmD [Gynuella sunshinyii]AJQ96723.1 heme exporter protein D [Gynuella sunshinyii YC6258]